MDFSVWKVVLVSASSLGVSIEKILFNRLDVVEKSCQSRLFELFSSRSKDGHDSGVLLRSDEYSGLGFNIE